MLRIVDTTAVTNMLTRRASRMNEAEGLVRPILEAVRKGGDKALVEYAKKFDGLDAPTVAVPHAALQAAYAGLGKDMRAALKEASSNIRAFAKLQLPVAKQATLAPGLKVGQVVRPLDVVAAYIPSGRYPLPSTLMMTAIPARVAGVPTICACSPRPAEAVMGTAAYLKVDHFFRMGGAHAIAAFAYGTKTVPRADRIVGPGNIYVAAAKKLLAGEVGIDFVAGPTEILIIAPEKVGEANPKWIAADMLAQAEHDTDASAILLTRSQQLAGAVVKEIELQLQTLPTAAIARKAIDRNSAIIVVPSQAEAVEIANRFAPEHLSIPDRSLLAGIRHAGSIFIGPVSTEAAGDYASGPNHVLPTSGVARLRGGLSTADYVKVISAQELNMAALKRLEKSVTTLARAEGLEAHARSVEVRTRG
ncbi:MAG TPA: histidinol dehydrogenase [Bryobacteraceae bacterium]|nr:histidinol dehydrogenase [Bryobacteraceae bacterium]